MISGIKVLDLSDRRGIMCSKVLSGLGAQVIQVEPIVGSDARMQGPFINDVPGIERSLYWHAYATDRRSITLDLTLPQGQQIFKDLVRKSDVVIESSDPGYLSSLNLGYSDLVKVKTDIIMASVTPFGQTGPKSDYLATDLTGVALGGSMHLTGEKDRAPVRIGHSQQFWLLGGASASAGVMIAAFHHSQTGEGQYIDVSCQQAVSRTLSHAPQIWDLSGENLSRNGAYRKIGNVSMRITYPCSDGEVSFFYPAGKVGARSMEGLANWMSDEGVYEEAITNVDWSKFEFGTISQEVLDGIESALLKFFSNKTKSELSRGAVKFRVILFQLNNSEDLLNNAQLRARGFWTLLNHPLESNNFQHAQLQHPGGFASIDNFNLGPKALAPSLGQHTDQILYRELGYKETQIKSLRLSHVI